jgi:branched-chain amino acid transport system ATP-binding protein
MSHELLRVEQLSAGYGDIAAIRDVSLTVGAGRITALLGRNGAGKSTTLRAISGLNRATSGSVLLDGDDITHLPPYARAARGLAFVQEGKRVFRSRTVEENLVLGGYARRARRTELAGGIAAAYERFPALGEKRREPAAVLSGGQQQMLAIAQALGSGPKLLLLDEPSVGLSPALVGQVLDTVRALRDEGLGILLVEQAVDVALGIADDVVVIDLGRVVFRGTRETPDLHRAVEDAYFGRLAQEIAA